MPSEVHWRTASDAELCQLHNYDTTIQRFS